MSKEKPPHQKSAQGKITRGQFHSVEHLVGTVTVQCSEIQFQCHLQFRQFQSRGHSALGTLLAASLACPKLHTRTWRDPGVGGALARLRQRVLRRPAPRNGRQGGERRRNAVRHRPNLLVAPRGLLRASARMRHRRRGLARAERVLCRRRAVWPFRRGQVVTSPTLLSWTLG